MFGGRSTPTKALPEQSIPDISPLLASELAIEYASLRAEGNCPRGIYLTPSLDTLVRWHGVFFVHRAPTIKFDSDVFHPMVDPKTKVWTARGRCAQWRPRTDHVPHLLHSLKRSFKSSELKTIDENEAVNKQIWSLYHHSHQTFLSMTSQRGLHSASRSNLFPAQHPLPPVPASPTSKTHARSASIASIVSKAEDRLITFRQIGEEEEDKLWQGMKESIGIE